MTWHLLNVIVEVVVVAAVVAQPNWECEARGGLQEKNKEETDDAREDDGDNDDHCDSDGAEQEEVGQA